MVAVVAVVVTVAVDFTVEVDSTEVDSTEADSTEADFAEVLDFAEGMGFAEGGGEAAGPGGGVLQHCLITMAPGVTPTMVTPPMVTRIIRVTPPMVIRTIPNVQ